MRLRPGGEDLILVLGGDGSILRALAREAGSGAPVIGVNYGRVGFLASIERETLERDLRRALARRVRGAGAPLAQGRVERRRGAGGQRPRPLPGRRVPHRRPHLRGRRRAGGHGPLRRASCCSTPGGLHGLQPGRRRAHGLVARALLRALVHRPPPPRQPPAGDRRRGAAHRHQQRPRRRLRHPGRRPAHRGAPRRAARSPSAWAGRRCTWRRSPRHSFFRRYREKFGRP